MDQSRKRAERCFFPAEDGIRGGRVTGVQTCALPIFDIRLVTLSLKKSRSGIRFCVAPASRIPDSTSSGAGGCRSLTQVHPSESLRRQDARSEERRVGKEGRAGGGRDPVKRVARWRRA